MPVRIVARHGLHFGFVVNVFVKRTPSRAALSITGVFTQLLPYAPESRQPQSSMIKKTMFGRLAGAAGAAAWTDAIAANIDAAMMESWASRRSDFLMGKDAADCAS